MAQSIVNLTRSEHEISQQLQRVEILHQQLKLEHIRAQELLQKLRSDDSFQQSESVSQRTRDWNRGTRQMNMKVAEYKDRATRLERAGAGKPELGIPEIKGQEKELRDLEKRVRGLEGRVRGFEGLPPDKDLALLEVERMRRELEGLVRKRDVSRPFDMSVHDYIKQSGESIQDRNQSRISCSCIHAEKKLTQSSSGSL